MFKSILAFFDVTAVYGYALAPVRVTVRSR